MVELRGSRLLIPALSGVVGGLLIITTFLVLITIVVVKCKTRRDIKSDGKLNKAC